ncbi:rhodanese-like domain-containing protein [Thiolapillus brandeum]|uniref:Rhodanese domain protein n=1 Tax=Thiolapillus brandeum TaxID=1076588 RepID=A0A7U6JIQ9_9GAMM|nr:rhodanese-like domain-containing protein [Thiolapillus brandeum]BAO45561.1 rhodanese domain protein [Thiolapillus brandeum]
MKKLLFFLLLLVSLPASAEVVNIDNAGLEKLIAQGVPVIDIRRPEEWQQTGIVKGSHLITFFDKRGNYNAQAWLDKLAPIAGKNDPFVLICRTGNRSGVVSRFLDQKLGYTKVYNVQKGITDWIAKGKSVVKPGN